MRHCPSCGYENDADATRCTQCQRALPQLPVSAPAPPAGAETAGGAQPSVLYPPPPPPPQYPPAAPPPEPLVFPRRGLSSGQKTGRYFLGIGLALLPAVVIYLLATVTSALGAGGSGLANLTGIVPVILVPAALIAMIYFLTQERLRFIGYGMLTVLVVAPVVVVVACLVILSGSHF
jgi:hypothetical protein